MATSIVNRLKGLLCQAQFGASDLDSAGSPAIPQDLFNTVCKAVFANNTYLQLWDEPVLSQLDWLFAVKPVEPTVHGEKLKKLQQRTQLVHAVNNFFFRVLDRESSAEEVFDSLKLFYPTDSSLLNHLKSSDCLKIIREKNQPSEKISTLLSHLEEKANIDLINEEPVKQCLEALKARERPGVAWALLINTNGEGALGLPLMITLETGNGQVRKLFDSQDDFHSAIERARFALAGQGFLKTSDDVLYSSILTDPQYHGSSIGLAAAVSMYGAARGIAIDPYTAFTGDINTGQDGWIVQGVSGLPQKLNAAHRCGCRRVFVPRDNLEEVEPSNYPDLQIVAVKNLLEIFHHLQTSSQPLPEDSLQDRKSNILKSYCDKKGWYLQPRPPIQNASQFHIAHRPTPAPTAHSHHLQHGNSFS